MKIAVLSDIHDNLENLDLAMKKIAKLDSDRLIYLGDFCAPFSFNKMAELYPSDKVIDIVFGNNDGDILHISKLASKFSNVNLHGDFAEIKLENCLIAINHYPEISIRLAQSGVYDAVFFGHNHKYSSKIIETENKKCILANPGEIMGRYKKPSFAIFDVLNKHLEHIFL